MSCGSVRIAYPFFLFVSVPSKVFVGGILGDKTTCLTDDGEACVCMATQATLYLNREGFEKKQSWGGGEHVGGGMFPACAVVSVALLPLQLATTHLRHEEHDGVSLVACELGRRGREGMGEARRDEG